MRKLLRLGMFFAVTCLAACGGESGSSGHKDDPQQQTETGAIRLSISPAAGVEGRMIDIDKPQIDHYDIHGIGPDGESFEMLEINVDGAESEIFEFESLAIGDWNIIVMAKNDNGKVLGGGESSVLIKRGAFHDVFIVVVPGSDPGMLDFEINWNATYLSNPIVKIQMKSELDGSVIDVEMTTYADEGESYTKSVQYSPGYYVLTYKLYDGDELIAAGTDLVRIVSGLTSKGQITLDHVHQAIGDLQLSFLVDIKDSIDVNTVGSTHSLNIGQSATITAGIEDGLDTVTYEWYVNGEKVSAFSENTLIFNATEFGMNRISVFVRSANDNRIGSGSFNLAVSKLRLEESYSIQASGFYGLEALDFNGDLDLDLVGRSVGDNDEIVMLNINGVIEPSNTVKLLDPPGIEVSVVGDVNNDGRLDVVVGEKFGGPAYVYYQKEDGTLEQHPIQGLDDTDVRRFALGKINDDSMLDLVVDYVPESGGAKVVVYMNTEEGFTRADQALDSNVSGQSKNMVLRDLNSDGYDDLVITGHRLGVYLNDGMGQLQKLEQGFDHTSRNFRIGDLNGDGHLDLVVQEYTNFPSSASVYINDGAGNFTLNDSVGANYNETMALGDVDGDGDLDIVFPGFISAFTDGMKRRGSIFLNNGNANFVDSFQTMAPAYEVVVADFDADGNVEIGLKEDKESISFYEFVPPEPL